MNIIEQIEYMKSIDPDISLCPHSYQLARQCSEVFSENLHNLFKVMFSQSDKNNDLHIIELYFDNDSQYLDISFDELTTASIFYRKKTKFNHLEEKSIFLKKVSIDEIYDCVTGLIY